MSREIAVLYWCDNNAAKHPPRSTPGDTVLVYSRDRAEVVEIELCDPCLSTITDAQMQEIAKVFGREQTPLEVDPALACPVVGCKRSTKPFKDSAGRRRHLTRVHPEWVEE